MYHLFKILVLLVKNWALISWDMSEIDVPIIKLVITFLELIRENNCQNINKILLKNWQKLLNLIFQIIVIFILLFLKKICETLNDSTKENKKTVIPDQLVLLFLNIVDDILNNR